MSGKINEKPDKSGTIGKQLTFDGQLMPRTTPIRGFSNVVVVADNATADINFSLSTTTLTEWPETRIAITPTSADSSVMLTWRISDHVNNLTSANRTYQLFLGIGDDTDPSATDPAICLHSGRTRLGTNGQYSEHTSNIIHIHNPNTTNRTVYSLFCKNQDSSIVYYQHLYTGGGAHPMRAKAEELVGFQINWPSI
tara:strand:- start:1736 stop:2323 length:588 start_codon:yes stop_codon:yes gene_type:complete